MWGPELPPGGHLAWNEILLLVQGPETLWESHVHDHPAPNGVSLDCVAPCKAGAVSSFNILYQPTFDLLCAELMGMLQELGKPWKISINTHYPFSFCGQRIICNSEPFVSEAKYLYILSKISLGLKKREKQ